MVDRVNTRIAAISDDGVRAMLPALLAARRELKTGLEKWLATAPDGEERFTAQQMRAGLLQLDGALRAVRRIHPLMEGALGLRSKLLGADAVEDARRQVVDFSARFGTPIKVDFDVAAIVAQGEQMLVPRFKASAQRYSDNVQRDIRLQLAIGVLRGETWAQMSKRLAGREAFQGAIAGVPGFKPTAGWIAGAASDRLGNKYAWWSERLVRTEMVNAYAEHHEMAIRRANELDPEIGSMWDSAADWRLCPVCRQLDGEFRMVGQLFEAAGVAVEHPPAHPCCRCVKYAWRRDWKRDFYAGNEAFVDGEIRRV